MCAVIVWETTQGLIFICGAAQPTDQGEESVVLLLLVVVVGETIFQFPMYSFLWCDYKKLCLKRGVKKQNFCLRRGVKRQKLCLRRGVKRQKLRTSRCIDLSNIQGRFFEYPL